MARKGCNKLLLAVAASICFGHGGVGFASTDDLRQTISDESKVISKAFGITADVNVNDGTEYLSQRDLGVTIGLKQLAVHLNATANENRIFRLRWILAHELWHQVQIGMYSKFPAKDAQLSRLFECQADMMAALYTGGTIFQNAAPLDNIERFDGAVSTAAEMAADLSNELVPQGGHPAEDQRITAVQFGMYRALAHRYQDEPASEQTAFLLSMLAELSETTWDEDPAPWSYRLCEKIVHVNSEAVGAITLQNESPRWPTGASSGWYRLRYGNSSDRPVRVTLHGPSVRI
jgi:hypothetical protein